MEKQRLCLAWDPLENHAEKPGLWPQPRSCCMDSIPTCPVPALVFSSCPVGLAIIKWIVYKMKCLLLLSLWHFTCIQIIGVIPLGPTSYVQLVICLAIIIINVRSSDTGRACCVVNFLRLQCFQHKDQITMECILCTILTHLSRILSGRVLLETGYRFSRSLSQCEERGYHSPGTPATHLQLSIQPRNVLANPFNLFHSAFIWRNTIHCPHFPPFRKALRGNPQYDPVTNRFDNFIPNIIP